MSLTLNSTFGGAYGSNMTLRSVVTESSTNPIANTSVVNVAIYLVTNNYSSVGGVSGALLTINLGGAGGEQNRSVSINVPTNATTLIHAENFTITHDDSGAKSFRYTANLRLNVGGYTFSAHTGIMNLTTFSRASTVSAPNGLIGSPITIAIDRKNSTYTHTVSYNFQGNVGTIATGVGTSVKWTPPMTLNSALPNSTSGSCYITVDTYSGTTKIGSNSTQIVLSVPDSVVPTISTLTLEEAVNSLSDISTSQIFVQTLSRVRATINGATGVYGSTITSYSIRVENESLLITQNGGVFDFFKTSGTKTVSATVTDSRGRVSEALTTQITVLPYASVAGSFTVKRAGANNNQLIVTRNAQASPLIVNGVQKNTLNIVFSYAIHNSTSYTDSTGSANESLTTTAELINSEATLNETFSEEQSYDIVMTVSDRFTSAKVLMTVGTITLPFVLKNDRLGFGKVPTIANGVDSEWAYYYKGDEIQLKALTSSDGYSIKKNTTNLDLIDTTGFYRVGATDTNNPTGAIGLLVVNAVDNSNCTQLYQSQDGKDAYFRAKTAGMWSTWKKIVTEDNALLISTAWTSTGVAGCQYRRNGNSIYFKFDVTPKNANALSLGSIPTALVPSEMFFYAPAHAQVNDANGMVQIDGSGAITLYPSRAIRYHSQITWSI